MSSCIEYSAKYDHCGFLLTDVVRSRKCGSHKLPFNFADFFWGLNSATVSSQWSNCSEYFNFWTLPTLNRCARAFRSAEWSIKDWWRLLDFNWTSNGDRAWWKIPLIHVPCIFSVASYNLQNQSKALWSIAFVLSCFTGLKSELLDMQSYSWNWRCLRRFHRGTFIRKPTTEMNNTRSFMIGCSWRRGNISRHIFNVDTG